MKKQTRAFTAPHEVYTGGVLYPAGHVFETDGAQGREWQPASEAEIASIVRKTAPESSPPGDATL